MIARFVKNTCIHVCLYSWGLKICRMGSAGEMPDLSGPLRFLFLSVDVDLFNSARASASQLLSPFTSTCEPADYVDSFLLSSSCDVIVACVGAVCGVDGRAGLRRELDDGPARSVRRDLELGDPQLACWPDGRVEDRSHTACRMDVDVSRVNHTVQAERGTRGQRRRRQTRPSSS